MNRRQQTLLAALAGLLLLVLALGGLIGPQGLQSPWQLPPVVWAEIRLPRTVGALLVGALLGLSGALAQGLFRNPLADPYLLGTASGAVLGVVLVLAAAGSGGALVSLAGLAPLARLGLALAAFLGALLGVLLTLLLAQGALQTLRLLLAGVVVSVLLGAVADLLTAASPDALRGRQAFLLGSTSLLSWSSVGLLLAGWLPLAWLALRHARLLDALTLGEASAQSLGLRVPQLRLLLLLVLAACTGLAVSQAGLVAFVGLVAPHLVRRHAPGPHGWLLAASSLMGAALLGLADLLARWLLAPQELPVGVVTGVLGGVYLFALLRSGRTP